MKIKILVLSAICFGSLISSGYSSIDPSLASSTDWKSIGNSTEIKVFKKDVEGSPVVAFKGEGVIKAKITKVASVLIDSSRAAEWIDRLDKIQVIRKISDTEYVTYSHIKTPIVMKDRDFVLRNKLEMNPKEKSFSIKLSSMEDPAQPKTNYIRGDLIESSFVLKALSDTETLVTAEIHTDPKGDVPKWIVNLFQKEWPYKTIQSLREQCGKADIQEDSRIQLFLKPFFPFKLAASG